MKQLNINTIFLFILMGMSTFSQTSRASENALSSGDIKSEVTESRIRFGLTSGITALSYAGAPANGFGFGVGLQYALSDKWALKTSFNQAFYLSGLAPLYSAVDIRAVYALTGSLIASKENISIGGNEVLKSEEYHRGGWRLEAISDLYFFNSVASVISFTGLGMAVNYELPSNTHYNFNVGVRMDFVSSSKVNLVPMQLYLGILF